MMMRESGMRDSQVSIVALKKPKAYKSIITSKAENLGREGLQRFRLNIDLIILNQYSNRYLQKWSNKLMHSCISLKDNPVALHALESKSIKDCPKNPRKVVKIWHKLCDIQLCMNVVVTILERSKNPCTITPHPRRKKESTYL